MPRRKSNGKRKELLHELQVALDDADLLKRDLRKAKGRVSAAMRAVDIHVQTYRAKRATGPKGA